MVLEHLQRHPICEVVMIYIQILIHIYIRVQYYRCILYIFWYLYRYCMIDFVIFLSRSKELIVGGNSPNEYGN